MNTISVSLTFVLFIVLIVGWWTGRIHFIYGLLAVLLGLSMASTNIGQSFLNGVNAVVTTVSNAGSAVTR